MVSCASYLDDRLLTLDGDSDLGLGQRDIHITALDVGGNRCSDVDVTNGLGPLVRELGLLGGFAGLAVFFLLIASRQVGGGQVLFGSGGGHGWRRGTRSSERR